LLAALVAFHDPLIATPHYQLDALLTEAREYLVGAAEPTGIRR
jgi:hypothetical protein